MYFSAARIPEALRLLEQAIERDPHYGPALAWAAQCCRRLLIDNRAGDSETTAHKGIDFGRRALQAADDDPITLANAATALAGLGEDVAAMITWVDRALVLNPSYARGWHLSGALRMWAGQPDIAIEHVEMSLRLSPRARVGTSLAIIGISHFLARRFDEAVPKLLLALQDDPSTPANYRFLTACYAHMGRIAEARDVIDRLRSFAQVEAPEANNLRNPEHRDLYLSGLRLAIGEGE